MDSLSILLTRHEKKFAFGIITVLVFILYGWQLGGFWRSDDTAILLHVMQYSLLDIFTSPSVWQQLSPANLTPWVSLSFALDYRLAGLTPGVFYFHQLLSISLTAWMAFVLLSRRITAGWALAGVVLFLLGIPVENVSAQLMTRHYVEGLLFSLCSLYFLFEFEKSHRQGAIALSILFYGLALTAKEVYAPLAVLTFFLVGGSYGRRAKIAGFYFAAAFLYSLWRHYMLADLLGGYTGTPIYFTVAFWQLTASTFFALPRILLGQFWPLLLCLYILLAVIYFYLHRARLLPGAVVVLLVLAPLIPLVSFPGITGPNRYLFLPWFVFCFSLTLFCYGLYQALTHYKSKAWALGGSLSVLCAFFVIITMNLQQRIISNRLYLREVDVQMEFVRDHDRFVSFIPSPAIVSTIWLVRTYAQIKLLESPQSSSPETILDPIFLQAGQSLYEYSASCQCMTDISGNVSERIARVEEMTDDDAPLSLTITNSGGLISWQFGPYESGSWRVISGNLGNMALPRSSDLLRTSISGDLNFYLLYISPEGWRTYSPMLTLEPTGVPLSWKRGTGI